MSEHKRKRLDLSEDGAGASKKQFQPPTAPSASSSYATGSGANPLTGKPFSPNYWKIFETRKTLPVYAQREEFREMLASTQCMILVGETGSGSDTNNEQNRQRKTRNNGIGKRIVD